MVLRTATILDEFGSKAVRKEIAMIKYFVPKVVLEVIDRSIQLHGAAGVSDDFILAQAWAGIRTLRIADGPDAVHLRTVRTPEKGNPCASRVMTRDVSGCMQVALLELKDFMQRRGGDALKAKL